jgi:N-acetylmuramoyl-L-alanine amidase
MNDRALILWNLLGLSTYPSRMFRMQGICAILASRARWKIALTLGVALLASLVSTTLPAAELKQIALRAEAAQTEVRLQLNEATKVRFFGLSKPNRAVIDFDTTTARRLTLPAPQGSVLALRQAARPGGAWRVVLELPEGASVSWQQPSASGGRTAEVILRIQGGATAAQRSAEAATPPPLKAVKAADSSPFAGQDVVVAIDAGHGGKDPGALGRGGTREKDVVLEISRLLAARINREPGMRAFLTREGDYFLTLRQRIRRARDAGAQLFVSVHADAVLDSRVSGSSVYVLSLKGASDEQARLLADRENAADLIGGGAIDEQEPALASVLVDLVQSAQIGNSMEAAQRVLDSLGKVVEVRKPKVQQAGFVVLKSPDIPSMLVETAFISNPADERRLKSSAHREKLSEAIFQGVQQYFIDHPPDGSRLAAERQRPAVVAERDNTTRGGQL